MNIGEQIKNIRKAAGLTQKQLAEKAGVAAISIQQYERGVREPKLEAVRRIAIALNKTVFDFDHEYWGKLSCEEKATAFDEGKASLLLVYDQLNAIGREKAIERIEELAKIPEYQQQD